MRRSLDRDDRDRSTFYPVSTILVLSWLVFALMPHLASGSGQWFGLVLWPLLLPAYVSWMALIVVTGGAIAKLPIAIAVAGMVLMAVAVDRTVVPVFIWREARPRRG